MGSCNQEKIATNDVDFFLNCHSALLRQEKTYDHFSNEDNEEDDEDEQDEDIMLLTMSGGSSASNLSQRKHVLNGTYVVQHIPRFDS